MDRSRSSATPILEGDSDTFASLDEEDPESDLGPLLGEKLRELQDLRLTLLFTVVFGEFEVLDDDDHHDDRVDQAGNIVIDGVPLAYKTLF